MTPTKGRFGLLAAALVLVAGGTAVSAGYGFKNSMRFTQPVALPGVVLYSGSYSFEVIDPELKLNIIRVTSTEPYRLRYSGFARRVPRPAGMPSDSVFTLGEAQPGEPVPLKAWFPRGEDYGHEFVR